NEYLHEEWNELTKRDGDVAPQGMPECSKDEKDRILRMQLNIDSRFCLQVRCYGVFHARKFLPVKKMNTSSRLGRARCKSWSSAFHSWVTCMTLLGSTEVSCA